MRGLMIISLSGALALVGCGQTAEESGAGGNASAPAAEGSAAGAAPANVPDACTFIPKAELEELIGRELRDGDPNDMPPGSSQCDFETPPQMSATRTFDNPPLPEAAGFSSVTVTTHPSTVKTFGDSQRLIGASASPVAGIGDAAYFEGAAVIHVRKGDRGFGIRLHVSEPETDAGRARLRDVLLSLARAGAAKL